MEGQQDNTRKAIKILRPRNILLPIILGLGLVAYLFLTDEDRPENIWQLIRKADVGHLILAFIVMIARDVGYTYRIRIITNKELTWWNAFIVIMLWEFASAVTPSVVGGTAAAIFILMVEKIKFGRSIAYVMLTAIFDNLFFIIAAPLALVFLQGEHLFIVVRPSGSEYNLFGFFLFSYILITFYTVIMSYALFVRPRGFKWLMLKVTSWKILRRWRNAANEQGNEVILASHNLVGKSPAYWIKIIMSTIFIWSSRYLIVNFLAGAYVSIPLAEHFSIFGKHIIMWITMLVSPTPGSSGTAEYIFPLFYDEILQKYTLIVGTLWRMMTYYPYLIVGAIMIPRWIRKALKNRKTKEEKQTGKESD